MPFNSRFNNANRQFFKQQKSFQEGKISVTAFLHTNFFSLQEALEPLCRLPFKEIRKLLSLVEKQIDWESLEVQVQFNFHSEVSFQVYEYLGSSFSKVCLTEK